MIGYDIMNYLTSSNWIYFYQFYNGENAIMQFPPNKPCIPSSQQNKIRNRHVKRRDQPDSQPYNML